MAQMFVFMNRERTGWVPRTTALLNSLDMSDSCDNRSRSGSARRSGSSRRRNISISSKGSNNSPIDRCRIKSSSRERIIIVSNSPNGTPTTSTPPNERPSPMIHPEPRSPLQQLWSSLFVPSKASEWPDEKSKEYWIGPFDMSYNTYAKKARDANWEEDEGICNTRKLAESLYDVGDFAGARYAWAQIADHYISEHQHTSRWPSNHDFRTAWDKQEALGDIAQASIGCILNAYLAQYPELCAAVKANDKDWSLSDRPHPVFTAVVDHEDDLTNSRTLYIMSVMLDYAFDIAYRKDHSWMRTVYQRALDGARQIAGLELSETIRLRQGLVHAIIESEAEAYRDGINANRSEGWSSLTSEQREAHSTQSTQIWKDQVEELYLQIIADQQNLQGTMAEAAIDSELELVNHYKSVGDIEKAKAKARKLIILTKDHLGEDHDRTFRCMASLSTLLLNTGSIEEAGLAVHDCLTKHQGIKSGPTDLLSGELREKFVTRRGWKEILIVRSELEKMMSPFHFIWADYRLYTLRTGTVTFAPSYPTDTEKGSLWGLAYQEPKQKKDDKEACPEDESSIIVNEYLEQQPRAFTLSRAHVEKFAFGASERDHEFLDLQVPYIPYQHFMTTSAYEAGTPYLEYVKAAIDRSISSYIYEEAATDTPMQLSEYLQHMESWDNSDADDKDVKAVNKQEYRKPSQAPNRAGSNQCVEVEFNKDPTTTQIRGFFNNIPSEAYISPELHVDLVSTQWADYQHFALHQLPDSTTEIEIAEGLSLPCHGYISGTWTDFDVCQQWKVHQVFVVDASFLPAWVNDGMPMLALRQETVQSSRYHKVTNIERRAFCARLNPSFYRYKPVCVARPCSVYERKMGKGTVLTNTNELTLWDEMNAREKWDRDFETRKPTNDADRAVLAGDLKAEDERRKVWNEEHRKKGNDEKESSSDLSMTASVSAQEGSAEIQSVSPSPTSEADGKMEKEAGGGGLVRKLRRLRVRRTKVAAQATQVASDVC